MGSRSNSPEKVKTSGPEIEFSFEESKKQPEQKDS
jgi:hypothetical protein